MSTLQPLNTGLKGWNRAWEAIKQLYGDYACECPVTGEVWQYLGTASGFHVFRHRSYQGEHSYRYEGIPVLPDDFDSVQ
jgi:hypothetical protein